MAKQIKLNVQPRSQQGRNAVKKIKSAGFVPAVIYGKRETPVSLQVSAREIEDLLNHATGENVLVELEMGGEGQSRLALIQEVQHHPVRRNVLHVDFHAVNPNEALHAHVPIEVRGEAAGVKNRGGLLELNLHSLEVECLPKDLPECIVVDVSPLDLGQAIHISDLQLPAGVVARGNPELTVLHVSAPKTESGSQSAAGAATQPEVLKEKKPASAAPAKK
jgi:large subunit ribosomal protein L25